MRIPGVVLAAGQGSISQHGGYPRPKVLEEVDGQPMLVRVIKAVRAACDPCIVVVNPRFERAIKEALQQEGVEDQVCYAVQPERRGTADAVARALPLLPNGACHFLVTYADMPLWRSVTMRGLAYGHKTSHAKLSMVTVALNGHHPPGIERYGRIVRDEMGRPQRIVEVFDAGEEFLAATRTVNPSLWVFDRAWFESRLDQIPLRERDDGFGPERYLPPLVGMASKEGAPIFEFELEDAHEALGVNTEDDLEEVRAQFARCRS